MQACAATLDRYASRLARALAHVINLLDPDVIVLGGGLSSIGPPVRRRCRASGPDTSMPNSVATVLVPRGARRRERRARRRATVGPLTRGQAVETQIPARLDRLPWSPFHWRVVLALGATWVLDGLEVTFKGAVSGVLQLPETLHFSPAEIGALGSAYLAGAVLGALLFGWLTDRHGRKRLFFVTLAVYLAGVALSAFAWNLESFLVFRFITGWARAANTPPSIRRSTS